MQQSVSFSIIVPMYNMENYIEKCLDSILKQEYENYEIIVIDDGSEDDSLKIVKSIAEKEKNVKVIHKENGGICSACEAGLSEAKKEYIVFVDADDTLKGDSLKVIAEEICADDKIDILQFGIEFTDGKKVLSTDIPKAIKINGTDRIINDHYKNYPTPSLACRAFARHLFSSIEYYGRNIGIDELLIIQLLQAAEAFKSIPNVLYSVYVRTDSVSRARITDQRIDEYINIYRKMIEISVKKDYIGLTYTYIKYMKLLIGLIWKYRGCDGIKKLMYEEYISCFKHVKKSFEYKNENIVFRIKNRIFYTALYFKNKNIGGAR